jgi:hypothetical protein
VPPPHPNEEGTPRSPKTPKKKREIRQQAKDFGTNEAEGRPRTVADLVSRVSENCPRTAMGKLSKGARDDSRAPPSIFGAPDWIFGAMESISLAAASISGSTSSFFNATHVEFPRTPIDLQRTGVHLGPTQVDLRVRPDQSRGRSRESRGRPDQSRASSGCVGQAFVCAAAASCCCCCWSICETARDRSMANCFTSRTWLVASLLSRAVIFWRSRSWKSASK